MPVATKLSRGHALIWTTEINDYSVIITRLVVKNSLRKSLIVPVKICMMAQDFVILYMLTIYIYS